jgi:hypothetical protein
MFACDAIGSITVSQITFLDLIKTIRACMHRMFVALAITCKPDAIAPAIA